VLLRHDVVREAVRPNDKTGERILGGLLADADQQLPDEAIAGDVSVLKASADPAGSPRGCQEDYLVARRASSAGWPTS
jgi:proteasome accessory factor A